MHKMINAQKKTSDSHGHASGHAVSGVLKKVSENDPSAMALLKDLLVQFQERSSQMVKH